MCEFIRKSVVVCRFIYETEQFNGIGELLEILGRSASVCMCNFCLD